MSDHFGALGIKGLNENVLSVKADVTETNIFKNIIGLHEASASLFPNAG